MMWGMWLVLKQHRHALEKHLFSIWIQRLISAIKDTEPSLKCSCTPAHHWRHPKNEPFSSSRRPSDWYKMAPLQQPSLLFIHSSQPHNPTQRQKARRDPWMSPVLQPAPPSILQAHRSWEAKLRLKWDWIPPSLHIWSEPKHYDDCI